MAGKILQERRFSNTELGNNHHKFWYIRIYEDFTVEVQYGRQGDVGQTTQYPMGSLVTAESLMANKIKSKTNKSKPEERYRENDVVEVASTSGSSAKPRGDNLGKSTLIDLAVKQIAGPNDATIQSLVRHLAEQNKHQIMASVGTAMTYNDTDGLFRTTVGVVTLDVISQARDVLGQISDYLENSGNTGGGGYFQNGSFESRVNDYLMLIPQNIGRTRMSPEDFFPNISAVSKQSALLDDLESSYKLAISVKKSDDDTKKEETKPEEQKIFFVTMQLVDDTMVIDDIKRRYNQTRQSMHACYGLDVKRVFSIEIATMKGAFDKKVASMDPSNVQKLWHGTRVGNVLSILKGGFVIPPSNAAHCTGRMFSNGMYFSDQSTKSLNYAYGVAPGQRGGIENSTFMFMCDVAMGKAFTPPGPSQNLPRTGYDSTFAKAGLSGVSNNEMIVYSTSQVNPVFLVEFSR